MPILEKGILITFWEIFFNLIGFSKILVMLKTPEGVISTRIAFLNVDVPNLALLTIGLRDVKTVAAAAIAPTATQKVSNGFVKIKRKKVGSTITFR
ncbi:hypothetical protein HYS03_02670 [Candidatus Woesebacteria bacterium]|nr:hypothetical protein [Candidatus Woesebacteria bacterium]